ncbi:MAG: hypothetical protein KKH28_13435 [Elusimicrobia bacterium]|nr:hypothetical protein [Elusimicrobiota bacterium]
MNNKYLPYLCQVSIFAFLSLPFESPVFFWAKLLALLLLVGFAAIIARKDKKSVFFCGAFLLFLAFWGMLSLLRNTTSIELILLEFKDFASLWLIMCVFAYFLQKKVLTSQFYVQAVIRAAVLLSILKLLLIFGTFFYQSGGSNFSEFVALAKWGGLKYITYPMSATIYRVQFSSDIIIPFLIFILFNTQKTGIAFKKIELYSYPVFFLLSVFFVYSRYIYFLVLLVYLFSIIANRKNLFHIIVVSGFSMAAILGLTGGGGLCQIVETRSLPNSAENRYSDMGRKIQVKALLSEFYSHPVLGKGLGAYADSVVRDERLKYTYEVQIVAMLMKFGVLGMIILCSFMSAIYFRLVLASVAVHFNLPLLSLFFFWLLSGFTNPYLVSSYSAVIFILFYSLFYLSSRADMTPDK